MSFLNLCFILVPSSSGKTILPDLLELVQHIIPLSLKTSYPSSIPFLSPFFPSPSPFPSPLFSPSISYLPDLLKLVLPGVDPCDPTKTSVTLKLLSVILSWIPLKTTYTATAVGASSSPSTSSSLSVRTTAYLSSVNILPTTSYNNVTAPGNPPVLPSSGSGDSVNEAETAVHLDTLGGMIGEWALSLLDKVGR